MIKTIFLRTKTHLILCGLMVVFFSICVVYYDNKVQIKKGMQQRLVHLKHLRSESQQALALIEAHEDVYESFERCQFGSAHTEHSLREALPYHFESDEPSLLETGLKSQNVTIYVPCLRESDVFACVNLLSDYGPGHFQIEKIEIKRLGALEDDILKEIALGKSHVLFEGRIFSKWIHQ